MLFSDSYLLYLTLAFLRVAFILIGQGASDHLSPDDPNLRSFRRSSAWSLNASPPLDRSTIGHRLPGSGVC